MSFATDLTSQELEQIKKKSQNNQDKYARPLTFAEQKVNFDGLDSKMRSLEDKFNSEFESLLKEEQERLFTKIKKIVENNDVA